MKHLFKPRFYLTGHFLKDHLNLNRKKFFNLGALLYYPLEKPPKCVFCYNAADDRDGAGPTFAPLCLPQLTRQRCKTPVSDGSPFFSESCSVCTIIFLQQSFSSIGHCVKNENRNIIGSCALVPQTHAYSSYTVHQWHVPVDRLRSNSRARLGVLDFSFESFNFLAEARCRDRYLW